LNNNNYIIAHCEISKNGVYKNGQKIFDGPAEDVQDILLTIYQHLNLNYPKFYKMDSLSKLGWLASEVLLAGENIIKDARPQDVGVILSNANSSLDTDIKYLHTVQDFASPALFVYTLPNIVTGEICIKNNFKGESAFFISDALDAAFTEQYVNYLLNNNILQVCICGWVEILKDNYKAVLFLVAKATEGTLFTKENLDNIFNRQTL